MKKKMLFLSIFLMCLVSYSFIKGRLNKSGIYTIKIENKTNKMIDGLNLGYKPGKSIKENFSIAPKETEVYNVKTDNIDGETAIILYYVVENKRYEEYIEGYIERNYTGKAHTIIENENEKLKFEIK